jgi:hypothetical protein
VAEIPTPTTIGELAILVTTKLENIEKQLDGLPAQVQELQYEVKTLKQRAVDRRQLMFTWLGMAATFAAGVAGVVIK